MYSLSKLSVVVDSLFIVAPIVLWGGGGMYGPYNIMQYVVSVLVSQSSNWGRERNGCLTFIAF